MDGASQISIFFSILIRYNILNVEFEPDNIITLLLVKENCYYVFTYYFLKKFVNAFCSNELVFMVLILTYIDMYKAHIIILFF